MQRRFGALGARVWRTALLKGPVEIDKDTSPAAASFTGYAGEIDELQISKTARPAGFIRFAAVNQGTTADAAVCTGVLEDSAGGPGEDGASHLRVASKYPNLTRRHYEARGIQAEVVKLNGAMELAPGLGLAGRIVVSGRACRCHAQGVAWTPRVSEAAASYGHLHALKWCEKHSHTCTQTHTDT